MRYSTEWARRRDAERNSQSFASRSGRLFTSLKIEMLSSLLGPIGLRRRHLETLIGRPVAVVLSGTHVYQCIGVVIRLSVSGWKHVSERTTRTNWQKAGPRTVGGLDAASNNERMDEPDTRRSTTEDTSAGFGGYSRQQEQQRWQRGKATTTTTTKQMRKLKRERSL